MNNNQYENKNYKSKFYNEKHKEYFLEELILEGNKESYREPFKRLFTDSKPFEEEYQKDLYDFNYEEADAFLNSLKVTSIASATVRITQIKKYVFFSANYAANNTIGFYDMETTTKAREIAKTFTKNLFNKQDLIELTEDLSPMQSFILWSMFEGVNGKENIEIRLIKAEDVVVIDGKYYLDIYNEEKRKNKNRRIQISKEYYNVIMKANEQRETDTRESTNSKFIYTKTNALLKSPYVLRQGIKRNEGRENQPAQNLYVGRLMTSIKMETDLANLTTSDLTSSGIGEALSQMTFEVKEDGTKLIRQSDWDEIAEHFGLSSSRQRIEREIKKPQFVEKFGKYIYTYSKEEDAK